MRALALITPALVAVIASAASSSALAEEAHVVVYDGYGTPSGFVVSGRVLADEAVSETDKAASGVKNLVHNVEALDGDRVRGANVAVTIVGHTYTATTDRDGRFEVRVKGLPATERLTPGDAPVTAAVPKAAGFNVAPGSGVVYVLPDAPFIGLISDVDDTVVKTYVTDKKKMLGAVLFKNGAQSEPVEGAAANYAKAKAAGVRAFFYVSGSPQNFYPRIRTFLDTHGFPLGPLVLKTLGEDSMTEQFAYKTTRIEAILDALPTMKIVCVGDSGEKDPEIYAEIRRRHPDRVTAVVIREVARSDVRPERFPQMILVDDKYAGDDVIARLLTPPPPP